jgi:short-chain fatty acids transporter
MSEPSTAVAPALDDRPPEEDRRGGFLDRLQDAGVGLTAWSERWIPDAWVVALIMTIPVFVMALIWGDVDASGAFVAWGDGIWTLLTLMAEFSFAIVIAYAVAVARPVARLLNWIASRPDPAKPAQAVLVMAAFSYVTAWLNWAVAIVMSAVLVLFMAKNNPRADYRLLACAAFLGFGTVWNAGLSSSSALIVATPDNFLITGKVLANTIPISETILTPWNIVLSLVVAVLGTAFIVALTPRPEKAWTMPPDRLEALLPSMEREPVAAPLTPAQRMESWRGWNLLFGVATMAYLVHLLATKGIAGWTIDAYNLLFLSLAILLHGRPRPFLDACERGIRGAWGILLVFPFFAGMFGLIQLTHLGTTLSDFFASITTAHTFAPIVYWYSGILNYFVPSAGAKWALEAPYLIPAAASHGVSPAGATMAYSWGDLGTALIQPFWAIALLAIVRLKFGQIMGYCLVIWVPFSIVATIGMFLMPIH